MNTITRVVAWIHVILCAAVLFLLSAMLGGGTAVTDALTSVVEKVWLQGIVFIRELAALSGTALGIVIGSVIGVFLLWAFLLRKQAWAWWGLMVLLVLGVAEMFVSRFPTDYPWLNTLIERSPRATVGHAHFLAGLVLLLDHPWNWRGRRSGTRRRRKKSSTSSSSTRIKSRRRRSRRR